MDIKFTTRGVPQLMAWMRRQLGYVSKVASRAFAEYIVGNEQHGLRHAPPYKYITPFRSYSFDPIKAAKQRGWIFTHLDQIGKNNRTGQTTGGWTFKPTGANAYQISNATPGAPWTFGESLTRQNQAVGWRKWRDIIATNMDGAIRHMKAEVRKALQARNRA